MLDNNKDFKKDFNGKKVIVTGHTGFKGSWLSIWLHDLGAKVIGISKDIPTQPSLAESSGILNEITDYRENIKEFSKISDVINDTKPDFIFHLAAQPLVRRSYDDPIDTWNTNLIGSINILESLKRLDKKCSCVMITSDKCYDNQEWFWGYKETDRLGGTDPYSASKGSAEIAIRSYNESYFLKDFKKIKVASVRAGNVIGGGDWAADRIIPDCIRSWSEGKEIILRNPNSTRPWQHVLEPLSGYISTASALSNDRIKSGESFNFGPLSNQDYSVNDLVRELSNYWQNVKWSIDNSGVHPHESGLLKLNCDKALSLLNWAPSLDFSQTVNYTASWYKYFQNDSTKIYEFTKKQIREYIDISGS